LSVNDRSRPTPRRSALRRRLLAVQSRLESHYGPLGWWPAESAFEVCAGAILTQNTAWRNAEAALDGLRRRGLLDARALVRLGERRLAVLLRPAGTYRVKARRLLAFVRFLEREFGGRAEAMAAEEPARLRQKLLAVPGIGPETADAIALYAAGHASFVVDAYTRRILGRLGLLRGDESYATVRGLLMDALPRDVRLYNEYHAQLVALAKDHCRVRPRCTRCPLARLCPRLGVALAADPGAGRS